MAAAADGAALALLQALRPDSAPAFLAHVLRRRFRHDATAAAAWLLDDAPAAAAAERAWAAERQAQADAELSGTLDDTLRARILDRRARTLLLTW